MILKNEIKYNLPFLIKYFIIIFFLSACILTFYSFYRTLHNSFNIYKNNYEENLEVITMYNIPKEEIKNINTKGYEVLVPISYDSSSIEMAFNLYSSFSYEDSTKIYIGRDFATNNQIGNVIEIKISDNTYFFDVFIVDEISDNSFYLNSDYLNDYNTAIIEVNQLGIDNLLDCMLTYFNSESNFISLYKSIRSTKIIVILILSAILLAYVFFILSFFLYLLNFRNNFIGILRAVGYSFTKITFLYFTIIDGLLLISCLLGYGISFWTVNYLNISIESLFNIEVVNDISPLAILFIYGIVTLLFIILILMYNMKSIKKKTIWQLKEE